MSKCEEQFITGTDDSKIYYDPHWGHIMFRHSGGGIGVKLGSLTGKDFRKLADYVDKINASNKKANIDGAPLYSRTLEDGE